MQKVQWIEGMFLTPQHFQQQERYLEQHACLLFRLGADCTWGFSELRLDNQLAKLGKIGLLAASGVLPDMTPFDMPYAQTLPVPVTVSPESCNVFVYLALPLRRTDIAETSQEASTSRYRSTQLDVMDTASGDGNDYRIDVCDSNFRLVAGSEDLAGYACIPVARILEVREDKSLSLDQHFIAPCLDINVSELLRGFVAELAGMLQQRADMLAARTSDGHKPGTAEFIDYLMLLVINRYTPILEHYSSQRRWQPQACHALLLQLAGELSTFGSRSRRPPQFPAYRHHALQETFTPLISNLRQSLSAVIEQAALALPFALHSYGIRVATIVDRSLLETAQFFIAVKADMPPERICERFVGVAKLAPVEHIRQLVNHQLPGIKLHALQTVPRQIPWHADFSYFAVERCSELWPALQNSGGFALHVGEGFPSLELEFWAIRE